MSEAPDSAAYLKRSFWLATIVGWLAQLGLKVLLPTVVLVATRTWVVASGNQSLWLENPDDASHPVWFVLQAAVFFGSVFTGVLAGLLSPRKSFAVPVALVTLSLLATFFEQFPSPLSVLVGVIWAGGPCVGLLVGYMLVKAR